jgi:hypothetical protein
VYNPLTAGETVDEIVIFIGRLIFGIADTILVIDEYEENISINNISIYFKYIILNRKPNLLLGLKNSINNIIYENYLKNPRGTNGYR